MAENTNMRVTRPAIRYHGGKWRLAPWIIGFFPQHKTYVEPYGGAASVLLQKARCYAEVYNDLDGEVVNFFQVLRDEHLSVQLVKVLQLTPYSRADFEQAWIPAVDPVERARRLCIRAQMGFGSAGATKGHTGFRIDTQRSYSTAQHLWIEYPASLSLVGKRFSGVLIENRPALDVLKQHDTPETLHYVDPPYLPETRVLQPGRAYYRHEMSYDDHAALIDAIKDLQGMVVLSGYDNDLYKSHLRGWAQHSTSSRISGRRGTVLRTESVWINPACSDALDIEHRRLFA